jgi:hypothetical protein
VTDAAAASVVVASIACWDLLVRRIAQPFTTANLGYSEMGRYLTAAGKPTNDEQAAAIDKATGKPVENGARNIWVTSTALTTALNTSFFAENVASFAIVMGIALLLTGIGFLVLTLRLPAEAAERARAAVSRSGSGQAATQS